MNYMTRYETWLNHPQIDSKTKQELLDIKDKKEEIEDRFYKTLSFGTAGLRGKLGAGTNRMNQYNVGKVTQGIANYIKDQGQAYMDRGVVIAYDCRHFSQEYSKLAALIFAANGIKAYWFESLRPTPELSYTLLQLKASAGIILTASHNPKDYNGYKVYWEDGAQVLPAVADGMTNEIEKVDIFDGVHKISEEEARQKGLFEVLGKKEDDAYLNMVKSLSLRNDIAKDMTLVYTPLNGTGSIPVQRVLKEQGFTHVHVVKEQEKPDPDFTTVGYPNPEDPKAFKYAEALGKSLDADLLLATDPDCDRLAIEVKDENGDYLPFNGNQTGAILIHYLVSTMAEQNKLPDNPAIVKSIVTGDMGKIIASDYGVTMFEALTGFKNICGRIPELKDKGYHYIFGYEESIGYTTGTQVRDKDGVSSAMLLCEAAAYHKKNGHSLIAVLNDLYTRYGYFKEKQVSLVLEGIEGQERIQRMMKAIRQTPPMTVASQKVQEVIDYMDGYKDIPASNVLKFVLDNGDWYAVRPSGTEPKIKLYIYTRGPSDQAASQQLKAIETKLIDFLEGVK